ncbi:P-loop containing nucleoside triphosphate hydrolase protein [Agrocybe pediades]|nr:P-loop containing nucleoside triphosphate hydrolase protein [Agrocybe pediades]
MNSIPQRIFPRRTPYPSSINIRQYSIRHVGEAIRHLTNDPPAGQPSVIGIACHAGESGVLEFISLSNTDTAFLIRLGSKSVVTNADFAALCHPRNGAEPTTCLVGFSMAKVAVQVSDATHLRVKGVDLSTLLSPDTWRPKTPLEIITNHVSPGADKWGIVSLWHGNEQTIETDLCLQAWLAAWYLSPSRSVALTYSPLPERQFLVDVIFQSMRLESLKPKEVANEFVTATPDRSGRVDVVNSRYKTRIRRSEHVYISGNEYIGNAQAAKGKKTTIKVQGNMGKSQLASVTVIGRQEPTNPERARDELIHRLLINQTDLRRSPFIRAVWFPKWKNTTLDNEDCADGLGARDPHFEAVVSTLNDSQKHVVSEMIFGQHIVVTHGPPGTGKTTTIAAASKIWDRLRKNVWIVAHSNVAVKNIAEALAKRGVDFKLVVSKEFHHEWHEHIYKLVEKALIISDELPDNPVEMERILRGSRIILCTLSMLSNPALQDNGTFDIVPVDKLVIDEASQISTYDFLHLFVKFQQTLGKVCFFGDPKQLPPYGKDNIPTMKTIFDVQHIPSQSFLDTQYRMPAAVGNFISTAVYLGRLKSARPLEDNTCLAFVNVDLPRGEEEKAGFSWKNTGEIQTIVHLVKNYYKDKKFTVITPYDAQRAAIQQALQSEKLPWESVYNIDSFQGDFSRQLRGVTINRIFSYRKRGRLRLDFRRQVTTSRLSFLTQQT